MSFSDQGLNLCSEPRSKESCASEWRIRIGEQFKAVIGVVLRPRQAMRDLPSDRIYLFAFVAPLYFGIARAFQPRLLPPLLAIFGGRWQIILFMAPFGLVIMFVSAWIMKQILKLFDKHLTVRKLMNIGGYCQVPRLIIAAIGYGILLLDPSALQRNELTPGLLAILLLGLAGGCYSLFLYVYGIVVSPSMKKPGVVAPQPSPAQSKPPLTGL